MELINSATEILRKAAGSTAGIAIIALFASVLAFNAVVEKPSVGVIKISGSIMSQDMTDDTVKMLRYARNNDSIKAVVLQINSPGGLAEASEEIYLEVLALRREKPVVASIEQIGASGAYFIAVAAQEIYAKPTSIVGSVGVIASLPRPEKLEEDALATGPYKETGSARRYWSYQTQLVAENFYSAVTTQRGTRLKMSREELARAEIYMGTEALRRGLIDTIGTTSEAIDRAAQIAGVANYEIVDINKELKITPPLLVFYVNESVFNATNTAPIYYYLYLAAR